MLSTGVVSNFHALSDFLTQLHSSVKAVGDAEARAAREHERMAALCAPFNLELPFAGSISTLGQLHSARAAECRGIYVQFEKLSMEQKARRISQATENRPQPADAAAAAADAGTADAISGATASSAGDPLPPAPLTTVDAAAANVLPTPYGNLEAALSALISGPVFSLGRYLLLCHRSRACRLCARESNSSRRYRLIYRDAQRDASLQHARVNKLKAEKDGGGDKLEPEVRVGSGVSRARCLMLLLQQRALQAKIDFWEETKNELVAEWQVSNHARGPCNALRIMGTLLQVTLVALEELQTQLQDTFAEGEKQVRGLLQCVMRGPSRVVAGGRVFRENVANFGRGGRGRLVFVRHQPNPPPPSRPDGSA